MSSPRERLPLAIQRDIERYTASGWKPALILTLIHRRYGRRLSHQCLAALKKGGACPRGCTALCPTRDEGGPTPATPWLDEMERERREKEREAEYFRYDV